MQSYSKNEAIDRINKLAKTGKAFLFIINYSDSPQTHLIFLVY